jgi:hypothetical protein
MSKGIREEVTSLAPAPSKTIQGITRLYVRSLYSEISPIKSNTSQLFILLLGRKARRTRREKREKWKGRKGEREKGRKGEREKGRKGEREKGRKGEREKGRKGEKNGYYLIDQLETNISCQTWQY